MSARYYLTPMGRVRLEQRAAAAREAYMKVCADNPDALESGDTSGWHDNFAFEENLRQMHQLARRVRELEEILQFAEVVPPHPSPDRAYIGTRVCWRYADEEQERVALIAGYDDGDADRGRLSYNSPLGRCIVGAEPGESREFWNNGTRREIEIVAVEPANEA